QRTLAGINPNLTIVKFQTFDEQIAGQFTEERMIARLTALFGALALLLAVVMRGVLIHIGIGLAIGIAAALLSVRFVESQLYEIKGIDAGVLLTAIFTLMAAACIA